MRDISTPAYITALITAGFRPAIGPEMPIASAHVLDNDAAPGRHFVRREGCPLRVALACLRADLAAAAAPRMEKRRARA